MTGRQITEWSNQCRYCHKFLQKLYHTLTSIQCTFAKKTPWKYRNWQSIIIKILDVQITSFSNLSSCTTFFRRRIIQKICSHPRHDVSEILQCWHKTQINLAFLLKNRWLLVILNIYFLFLTGIWASENKFSV
jgi:hypothetical protein